MAIFERDGWTCQLCWLPLDRALAGSGTHPFEPTIDHVAPLSLGGTNDSANYQSAHRVCNSRKGNRVEAAA